MPDQFEKQHEQPPVQIGLLPTLIQAACGLGLGQAKAISYYAAATHGMLNLGVFPALVLQGPPATGKSTILDFLERLCFQPVKLEGSLSKAELRDSLNGRPTALIEEADYIREWLIRNRYSRRTSKTSVKRDRGHNWESEALELFGATVLHRRPPFRAPAVQSRSITIRIRRAEGPFTPDMDAFVPYGDYLGNFADEVDWQQVLGLGGSRIRDTWAPLVVVARHLGDEEWLTWAEGRSEHAEVELGAGQEEEPEQAVFLALLRLVLRDDEDILRGEVAERMAVGSINNEMRDYRPKLNPWQIASILRDLGFEVRPAGGKRRVYTGGVENLSAVAGQLGIEDEDLTEAAGNIQA